MGILVQAARELIGVPFRLHGRDPETGLDCVGLVTETMRRAGFHPVPPEGYAMRTASPRSLLHFAVASAMVEVAEGGDVILAMVNPLQPHLLIPVPGGFVHAHAGIGRVTEMPGTLPWPTTLRWRVTPQRT